MLIAILILLSILISVDKARHEVNKYEALCAKPEVPPGSLLCQVGWSRASVATHGIRGPLTADLPERTRVLEADLPSAEEACPGSLEQAMGEVVYV